MAKTNFIIQHKNSSTKGERPTKLQPGEIAINNTANDEKIFIENTNGDLVAFEPSKETSYVINISPDLYIADLKPLKDTIYLHFKDTEGISINGISKEKNGDEEYEAICHALYEDLRNNINVVNNLVISVFNGDNSLMQYKILGRWSEENLSCLSGYENSLDVNAIMLYYVEEENFQIVIGEKDEPIEFVNDFVIKLPSSIYYSSNQNGVPYSSSTLNLRDITINGYECGSNNGGHVFDSYYKVLKEKWQDEYVRRNLIIQCPIDSEFDNMVNVYTVNQDEKIQVGQNEYQYTTIYKNPQDDNGISLSNVDGELMLIIDKVGTTSLEQTKEFIVNINTESNADIFETEDDTIEFKIDDIQDLKINGFKQGSREYNILFPLLKKYLSEGNSYVYQHLKIELNYNENGFCPVFSCNMNWTDYANPTYGDTFDYVYTSNFDAGAFEVIYETYEGTELTFYYDKTWGLAREDKDGLISRKFVTQLYSTAPLCFIYDNQSFDINDAEVDWIDLTEEFNNRLIATEEWYIWGGRREYFNGVNALKSILSDASNYSSDVIKGYYKAQNITWMIKNGLTETQTLLKYDSSYKVSDDIYVFSYVGYEPNHIFRYRLNCTVTRTKVNYNTKYDVQFKIRAEKIITLTQVEYDDLIGTAPIIVELKDLPLNGGYPFIGDKIASIESIGSTRDLKGYLFSLMCNPNLNATSLERITFIAETENGRKEVFRFYTCLKGGTNKIMIFHNRSINGLMNGNIVLSFTYNETNNSIMCEFAIDD